MLWACLMSTHNVCFYVETEKIIPVLSTNTCSKKASAFFIDACCWPTAKSTHYPEMTNVIYDLLKGNEKYTVSSFEYWLVLYFFR